MRPTDTMTPGTRELGHVGTRPVVEQTRVEGCLSYLLFDPGTREAAVIDPRFDAADALLRRLSDGGLELKYAIDTHAHADHVSGVARISRETGAEAIVSSEVAFPARIVKDGDRLRLGPFVIEVLATPGHTSESVTFHVGDAVFTGDALLIGGAGRTDFQNGSPETLFKTYEDKLRPLPPDTVVYPGHDYRGRTHSTIGDEWRANGLFGNEDKASFVARLTSGQQAEPANMRFVLAANRAGGNSNVATVEPAILQTRIAAGEHLNLIDVRSSAEFAGSRMHGARNIPLEQVAQAAPSIPPGGPVVLICEGGQRASLATTAFTGRTGVIVLNGGMQAWRKAGLPTEGAAGGVWPLERQVRLVAGAFVLVGAILGLTVNPWFFAIPVFFGAGLAFSGVSGTCGMGMVLAKMPWNRRALTAPTTPAAGGSCAAGGEPVGGSCAAGGDAPGGGGGCAA